MLDGENDEEGVETIYERYGVDNVNGTESRTGKTHPMKLKITYNYDVKNFKEGECAIGKKARKGLGSLKDGIVYVGLAMQR